MHRAFRELLLIVTGAALGDALLLEFGFFNFSVASGTGSEGLPLAWRWYATGYPPPPKPMNLDIDLAFWFVVSIILVEILARMAVPRLMKPETRTKPQYQL